MIVVQLRQRSKSWIESLSSYHYGHPKKVQLIEYNIYIHIFRRHAHSSCSFYRLRLGAVSFPSIISLDAEFVHRSVAQFGVAAVANTGIP